MKGATVNKLTTLLGVVAILAGICSPFFIKDNLAVAMTGLFLAGIVLIYVKNNDAIALTKRAIGRITK